MYMLLLFTYPRNTQWKHCFSFQLLHYQVPLKADEEERERHGSEFDTIISFSPFQHLGHLEVVEAVREYGGVKPHAVEYPHPCPECSSLLLL